ncbi:MAG: hypothetical protein WCF12_07540 [Propionicimonas sp.]
MAEWASSDSEAPWQEERSRRVAAAAVAAAAIGWWPAFTLGVYRVIFFEQHLALWAASTTAFLALSFTRGRPFLGRPVSWTLLLPSLWLLLTWLLPVGGTSAIYRLLYWIGVTVTVLGMPAFAALTVRLLIPGANRLHGKEALAAGGVVLLAMLASFAIGTQHPRILTCEDFTISGNFAPSGCSSGTGSTVQ